MLTSYLTLVKFKLSMAVTLSAVLGWFLYRPVYGADILYLIFGVFLLAGASASLNQFQERFFDARMGRTDRRPIPAGKILPQRALAVTALLAVAGLFLLSKLGAIPTLLGFGNLLIYNFLYTPLKRITSFALIPGGLVGAIPPMIGWTGAGGEIFHPTILFICTLMFLWQMPHFWLLIIRYGQEYEKAGFRTVSGYLNDAQIRRLIFIWICVSSLFLLAFPIFDIRLAPWLTIILILLNLTFIITFYLLLFRRVNPKHQKILFILGNVFLTVVLLLFILNSLLAL